MKRIVINILMTTLILCSSLNTWAYDFEAEGVYYNISSPTELTVEVTSGENAYRGEINLTHSVLFNGTTYQVTSIGERAFSNCDALTAITLPQNLKSIGKYAFNHCTSLYSIIIPETVTNINEGAFCYCSDLQEIHCQATTPPTCGGSSFYGVNTTTCVLYVPTGTAASYKTNFTWKNFANIVEEEYANIEQISSKNVADNITIHTNPNGLTVEGVAPGETISVYTLSGTLIYEGIAGTAHTQIALPSSNLYLVKCCGTTTKIIF